MTDPVLLRPLLAGDVNYVLSTWLHGMREADPSGLPDEFWYPGHRAFVEQVLSSRDYVVIVAAASDNPSEILGYCVTRQNPEVQILWVQVRKLLRGKGLAKRLLVASNCRVGCPSQFMTSLGRCRLRVQYRGRQLRKTWRPQPPLTE